MIVKVENVSKKYKGGVKALDNLSYEVRKGEIYGLLGPNGCGKTTSINCLLQLLTYDEGKIYLFDKEMTQTDYETKRRIGVVPQNVAVFDELTVYENIEYFCGLYIKDKEIRKKYVEEAIEFVSLEDYKKFYPKKLSGGLLRRLNIACGIAHKPELIIFDEPTVAVDPQSRNKILEGIVKLNELGSTIIYTSHYMEEVEQICTYIVILDKGKVVAHGTKEVLKEMVETGSLITIEDCPNGDELISKEDFVLEVKRNGKSIVVKTKKGKSYIPKIIEILEKNNYNFGNIYCEHPTLNDVFLKITGKELRD